MTLMNREIRNARQLRSDFLASGFKMLRDTVRGCFTLSASDARANTLG